MKRVIQFIFVSAMLIPSMGYAVDIAYRDLEGNTVRLADFKGKWVIVNYWATWCPPCLEEIPDLVMFHDKHKDKDAVVIGVNMEEIDREKLVSFVDDNLMSYPVIPMAKDLKLVGAVPGLPTTFLIDPDGAIAARQVGSVTAEGIENYIASQRDAVAKRENN